MSFFFLSWGSKTERVQVGTTPASHKCFYCDNIGPLPLYKTVERARLYWITTPLRSTAYALYCPNCQGTYELSDREGKELEQSCSAAIP